MGIADSGIKPLQSGSIYADYKHIDLYKSEGTLPRIHKSMGEAMAHIPAERRRGAIDFGACHGMLSIRAHQMGWNPVLGVELDPRSVDAYNRFVKTDGVELASIALDVRSPEFAAQCRDWVAGGYTTFLARRVLSELFATTYRKEGALDMGPEGEAIWKPAGHAFGQAARDAGVEFIVLEGRAYGPYKDRLAHPIYNTDREVYAIGPTWRTVHRYKEAVVMVPA